MRHGHPGYKLLDTPRPPLLKRMEAYQSRSYEWYGDICSNARLQTIDVAAATGLMFFMSAFPPVVKIAGIHVHTRAAPDQKVPATLDLDGGDMDTFIYFCVYVPISAEDRITEFAVRKGPDKPLGGNPMIGGILVSQTCKIHLTMAVIRY